MFQNPKALPYIFYGFLKCPENPRVLTPLHFLQVFENVPKSKVQIQGNSLKSHSHEIVTKKVQFSINDFFCYFCKGNLSSKKILEFVSERHVDRTFTTWVKTSLSYILIQSTCGTGKTDFLSQNKP